MLENRRQVLNQKKWGVDKKDICGIIEIIKLIIFEANVSIMVLLKYKLVSQTLLYTLAMLHLVPCLLWLVALAINDMAFAIFSVEAKLLSLTFSMAILVIFTHMECRINQIGEEPVVAWHICGEGCRFVLKRVGFSATYLSNYMNILFVFFTSFFYFPDEEIMKGILGLMIFFDLVSAVEAFDVACYERKLLEELDNNLRMGGIRTLVSAPLPYLAAAYRVPSSHTHNE
jgi:hypothetical protein